MLNQLSRLAFATLAATTMLVQAASAQKFEHQGANWKLLGEGRFGFRLDEDVIEIGKSAGKFDRLALEVKDDDVFIADINITYENGDRQELAVNQTIREGAAVRPLDLRKGRFIEKIEITARARTGFRGRATIEIYGDRTKGGGDDLVVLGSERFGARRETETFEVGRDAGAFSKLRFIAREEDIFVLDVRVTYGNGETQDFDLENVVREGEPSKPLELDGKRLIRSIEVTARARVTSPRDRGVLEIVGEKVKRGEERLIPLGSHRVGFIPDRDELEVDRDGRFSAIHVVSKDDDVLILSLRVDYGRGKVDEIARNQRIREGEPKVFVLDGNRRIERIEAIARARTPLRKRTTVEYYGEPSSQRSGDRDRDRYGDRDRR